MTRRVLGYLARHDDFSSRDVPALPPAFFPARVNLAEFSSVLSFMLDTGADYTMLNPTEALILLGNRYLTADFRFSAEIELGGIGGQRVVGRFTDATMTFLDAERRPLTVQLEMLIA